MGSILHWIITVSNYHYFILLLINQAQGGGSRVMNFGKSKAKLYDNEKKKVRFTDVAGADEEKARASRSSRFLKRST